MQLPHFLPAVMLPPSIKIKVGSEDSASNKQSGFTDIGQRGLEGNTRVGRQ